MSRRAGLACWVWLTVATPAVSLAGGLEVPDNGTRAMGRGGAYAAAVSEPSAIYYNPAALTQIDGFALTVNANLWLYDLSFQRAPLTVETLPGVESNLTFAPVENTDLLAPAPMLFLAYDFGLEDWGFGLGAYGPSGIGEVAFSAPDLDRLAQIPNDDESVRDFGHGYLMTEANMLLIYFSGAVAYDFGPVEVGLTLQLAMLDSEFHNASDGDGVTNANRDSVEDPALYTPSVLDVQGFAPTGIIGVRYQPIDQLTLSLSYRPRIVFEAKGELRITFPPALVELVSHTDQGATLSVTLPDVVRFGARWAFLQGDHEIADIELDVVYEAWSVTKDFTTEFDGSIAVSALDQVRRLPTVVIPKGYDDTLSVRLGSDVNVSDSFTVRAGGFIEGAANGDFFNQGSIRPGYANLDFIPLSRIGISIGASYRIGVWSIDLALMHVFSPEHIEDEGQIDVIYPLWVCQDPQTATDRQLCEQRTTSPLHAVNNGIYNVTYDLISLGFTVDL